MPLILLHIAKDMSEPDLNYFWRSLGSCLDKKFREKKERIDKFWLSDF